MTKGQGKTIVGLQIDFDCPTKNLDRYSQFLHALRKALDKEDLLSITALLDWFSADTKVEDVIQWVDEFVPQFYDVDSRSLGSIDGGISEPIGPKRWAPVFNAFHKTYRMGISSFGRLVQISPV